MFETQEGTRNRTRELQKKRSAFILSSDHWIKTFAWVLMLNKAWWRVLAFVGHVCGRKMAWLQCGYLAM